MNTLHAMAKKKATHTPLTSRPLFVYLDQHGIEPNQFAKKLDIPLPRLMNWKYRGNVPRNALPLVVDAMGITHDGYMALIEAKAAPKQRTLEGSKLLDDYNHLPEGLKVFTARRTEELRAMVESLPAFLRTAFDKAPTDPEAYRAFEKHVEATFEELKARAGGGK